MHDLHPVACVVVIVYLVSISDPLWRALFQVKVWQGATPASGPQVWLYTKRWVPLSAARYRIESVRTQLSVRVCGGPAVPGSPRRYK